MAWIAVDEDGECWVFRNKPKRTDDYWGSICDEAVLVPRWVADKLTVKPLTWTDETVELL